MFGLTNLSVGVGGSARRAAIARQLTTQTYSDVILADNPVAYWTMDEIESGTVVDQTGSNDLSEIGSISTQTGIINSSVKIIDENNYLTLSNTTFANNFTAISVEIWIYEDGSSDDYGLYIGQIDDLDDQDSDTYDGFAIQPFNNSSSIRWFGFGSNSNLVEASLPNNSWVHAVGTWNGSSMSFYVNSVFQGSISSSVNNIATEEPINFGPLPYTVPNPIHATANIDEVAIYDYILTAEQIAEHYAYGKGITDSYGLEIVKDTPLAYWRLDETSGTTAVDVMAGNDGTYNGSPMLDQSPLILSGRSVLFDGTDDFIRVGSLNLQTGSFSVMAWINPQTSFAGRILVEDDSFDGWALSHGDSERAGAIRFYIRGSNLEIILDTATGVAPAGAIAHVVGVYNASTGDRQIYVNNSLAASDVIESGGFTANTARLQIGAGDSSVPDHFIGTMDEPAIWKRALTSSEIADMYNAGI